MTSEAQQQAGLAELSPSAATVTPTAAVPQAPRHTVMLDNEAASPFQRQLINELQFLVQNDRDTRRQRDIVRKLARRGLLKIVPTPAA